MFDVIATILAWFYSQWPSFGMAIVFLTLTVMIVATPFTLKSTRSMLRMQQLQPEIKKIHGKYRDDRQKMNEELMKFYKGEGVNPVGGCLPMLIQMPVFIVLFQVVRGLTRRTTEIGTQLGFTTLRDASGSGFEKTPIRGIEQTFDPDYLSSGSELYQGLSEETEMVSWGIDLSRSPASVLSDGIVGALPYLGMILLVLVTGVYQQRQIMGRQKGAPVNPQQQLIMRVFPYFLPVFSYGMPAALIVYFIVSSLYRIGQQGYITRSLYSGEDSPGVQLARQRSSAAASDSTADPAKKASTRAVTPTKGSPTPKRDAKKQTGRSSARGKSRSGSGRTGKAPTRQRNTTSRTTPPGSTANRSKKKKKRR